MMNYFAYKNKSFSEIKSQAYATCRRHVISITPHKRSAVWGEAQCGEKDKDKNKTQSYCKSMKINVYLLGHPEMIGTFPTVSPKTS